MAFSPGLSRLSGVALAGLLLAGSTIIPSTSQTASQTSTVHPMVMQIELASDNSSANIPQLVHQQLQWNEVKAPVITAATEIAAITKSAQTQVAKETSGSSADNSKTVHSAQATPANTQAEKKQVSRGSSISSTIVDHALSLLGTPYVFGGTTKKGFDCSGFTQYIYQASGISLPRTSYSQFNSGVAVSKSDLQLGDLVFFSTYTKGASHVGIYIGGGRFVHADNPRLGVTITSLSNSYYTARYVGARRYN